MARQSARLSGYAFSPATSRREARREGKSQSRQHNEGAARPLQACEGKGGKRGGGRQALPAAAR
eukprot:COSAG03_NODE_1979_length_3263_cov_47.989268_3_plen_64_part_00